MNAEPMDLETLGASGRLLAIRQVRDRLYAVQAVITILATIVLLLVDGRLQLVPLFIPVSSFAYLLHTMVLVFIGEIFVFRYLEIRFAKNSTTRYYMVEKSQKKAVVGLALVLVFLIVALLPMVGDGMEDLMEAEGRTSGSIYFYNKDFSGLVEVDSISLHSSVPTEAYLVTESVYQMYSGNLEKLREYKLNVHFILNGSMLIDVPTLDRQTLYLVIDDATVQYRVETRVSPEMLFTLPIFLGAYALFFLGWVAYLMPARLKLAKEAIYR